MEYDLEIYFTGLCFFAFPEGMEDRPGSIDLLMVNAKNQHPQSGDFPDGTAPNPGHQPRMAISTRCMVPVGGVDWEPDRSTPGTDGDDLAVFDLGGLDLSLETSNRSELRVKLGRPEDRWKPWFASDNRWFDWTVDLPKLDDRIDKLKPNLHPATGGAVLTRLKLDRGTLSVFEVGRRRGDYIVFDFRTVGGREPSPKPQSRCITDRAVLRIDGLRDAAIIRDGERKVGVFPHEETGEGARSVRLSLTNLPNEVHPPRPAVYDFAWYYQLFDWKDGTLPDPKTLIIPWPRAYVAAGRTPSSGLCPPGGG